MRRAPLRRVDALEFSLGLGDGHAGFAEQLDPVERALAKDFAMKSWRSHGESPVIELVCMLTFLS
jgi:hypothetical protein